MWKHTLVKREERRRRLGEEHTFNFLLLIQGGHLDFVFGDRTEIDDTRWLSGAEDFLFEHIYSISAQLTRDASHQNVTKMPPGKWSFFFFFSHMPQMSEGRKHS